MKPGLMDPQRLVEIREDVELRPGVVGWSDDTIRKLLAHIDAVSLALVAARHAALKETP